MKSLKKIILLLCVGFVLGSSAYAGDTVNVMVFATPQAIIKMGGPDSATVRVDRDINNINQSFVNSKIDGYVRLVYRGDCDLPKSDMKYLLDSIIGTRNDMQGSINELWPEFGADVVVFIVDDSVQCGLAGDYGEANQAVMILNYKCMGANYSMARELGYLLGAGNNETQGGRYNPFVPYAHAYFHDYELNGDTVFSTIMGYMDDRLAANDKDFNMIPYWSTADTVNVRYLGLPVGDALHDNARQVRSGLKWVGGYRDVYALLRVDGFQLSSGQMAKLEITNTGYLENGVLDAGSNAWLGGQHMNIRNVRMRKGSYVSIGAHVIK